MQQLTITGVIVRWPLTFTLPVSRQVTRQPVVVLGLSVWGALGWSWVCVGALNRND